MKLINQLVTVITMIAGTSLFAYDYIPDDVSVSVILLVFTHNFWPSILCIDYLEIGGVKETVKKINLERIAQLRLRPGM
jgi:hypothetical protein